MSKVLFFLILFLSTISYAKTFNCYAERYCPTLNLHFNNGKILTECIGSNSKHPFVQSNATKIEIGKNYVSIYDLFGNPIKITEFQRQNKLGNNNGFFNYKRGNFLGYLNDYEFNMTIREKYFDIQIRELFNDNYKNIYSIGGYCDLIN